MEDEDYITFIFVETRNYKQNHKYIVLIIYMLTFILLFKFSCNCLDTENKIFYKIFLFSTPLLVYLWEALLFIQNCWADTQRVIR